MPDDVEVELVGFPEKPDGTSLHAQILNALHNP